MIVLDYKDARPIFEQITDRFQTLILKGVLSPDEQMPSVRSLAMDLSVNPNTIQKAYAELERRGYIYPVKGRGNFVSDPKALLEEHKKACRELFLKQVLEAKEYGITKDEILEWIKGVE